MSPLLLLTALSLIVEPRRPTGAARPDSATSARQRVAQGVYNGRANQLRVRPPRIDDDATAVDGALDEPQWGRAALLTGFSQFAPVDGVAAEDSTEVLVWYSPTAIHFGIRAFEPHGAVRATLADRDKIDADDNVQLLIGTFNDGRQATVFAVNPLGVQGDGTITETNQSRSQSLGGTTLPRDPADLSSDFVFQSKGRLTPDGYVVEVRIPFKSLKFQSADVQSWRLNVVRQVQHSGHEDSWAPARRAGLSFLGQSGSLEELTQLRRGVVLDVSPEVTQRTPGAPPPQAGGWRYSAGRPELGGTARWGMTNNLTLSATANPDFSQIESDAGQFSFDPRSALFFPEKRPFFLEGIEQFATPHSLIYTRRVVQPVGAVKLTGKVSGTSVAFLSAVDDASGSVSRADHPVYNLLRVQRDVGASSKLGMAYTDRIDGGSYNRVANVDASHLFGGIYSLQWQYAHSYTKQADGRVLAAPLWHAGINRNGKHLAFSYAIDGIHEDFRAGSGFITRGGVVNGTIDQRYTWFGAPGAVLEALTFNPGYFATWRYQSFVHQGDQIEKKLHLSLNATVRGGWRYGVGYFAESFGFDPGLYASYRLLDTNGDTLPFTGTPRIPNSEAFISLNTPQGARLSFNMFYIWGHDENFYEWATTNFVIGQYGLTYRPTDRLRVNATYNLQSFNRRTDGSIVANNRIPRLKVEYQIARPVFVRFVGEYSSFWRDALRDEGRTNLPIITYDVCGGNAYQVTVACQRNSFRGDFLFSYQPNPGTVLFVGYGAGYADTRSRAQPFEFPSSFDFRGFNRMDDAFFVKASYLFRL